MCIVIILQQSQSIISEQRLICKSCRKIAIQEMKCDQILTLPKIIAVLNYQSPQPGVILT
jgi:hypothetical protein